MAANAERKRTVLIVTAGLSRSGKSTAMNNIFGADFKSECSASSVTSAVEARRVDGLKGAVAYGNYFFPKKFEFVSLCSFICLQAVYQLSGPVCKATWNGCPSYSASYFHFTLCD